MRRSQGKLFFAAILLAGAGSAYASEQAKPCSLPPATSVKIVLTEKGFRTYRLISDGVFSMTNVPPPGCHLQSLIPGTYYFPLFNFDAAAFAEQGESTRNYGHDRGLLQDLLAKELGADRIGKDGFESWEDFWARTSLASSSLRDRIQGNTYVIAITGNPPSGAFDPYLNYQYDAETQQLSSSINSTQIKCEAVQGSAENNDGLRKRVFGKYPDIKSICTARGFYLMLPSEVHADPEAYFSLPSSKIDKTKVRSLAENMGLFIYGKLVQPYLMDSMPLIKVEGYLISDFETGEVFYRKELIAGGTAAGPSTTVK
jgi:hypothetical protein